MCFTVIQPAIFKKVLDQCDSEGKEYDEVRRVGSRDVGGKLVNKGGEATTSDELK